MHLHNMLGTVRYDVPVLSDEAMTVHQSFTARSLRTLCRQMLSRPVAFWVFFFLGHAFVAILGTVLGGVGDVYWYANQIRKAFVTGVWPAVDTSFVYPGGSLPVLLIPYIFGTAAYYPLWILLVTALNTAAALSVLGWNPRNTQKLWLCWWWLAFIVLLGPVALSRVDSVSVPITLIALSWLWRRPRISGALLALAGWIKIWPIAVFGALFLLLRRRWALFTGAFLFTIALVAGYLVLGASPEVIFGFITSQNDRGIQAEAVAATPFLWIGALGGPAGIVWNSHLLTNEIYGVGVTVAGDVLQPLMVLAAAALCALAVLARRSGARIRSVLPVLMLGLVLVLIVFNKVGSPQFMSWLAVPVIVGLVMQQRDFEVPARYTLIVAGLTQVIFPTLYYLFLWLNPALLIVATIRNGLLVFLLGWCFARLSVQWRDARTGRVVVRVHRFADRVRRDVGATAGATVSAATESAMAAASSASVSARPAQE